MRASTRRRFVIACGVATAGYVGGGGESAPDAARAGEGGEATWETGPPVPDERSEAKAATLDGRLYVVGGFVPEDDAEEPTDAATNEVAVYDPDAEEWGYAEPLPEALHHVSVAATDDRLYVLGGHEGDFEPVDSVHVFDGERWEAGEPLPTPRGALTAGPIGDRIYVAGGATDEGAVATLEVYDPAADEWETAAELPTPREHLASAVVDGRLYAIGGRLESGENVAATEAYDPAADEWETAAEMPTARSGHGAAAVDDLLYAVGGESFGESERTFDETEAYDPAADEWESHEPMPTPRHGLGTAAVGGDVYAAAGGPEPGFSYSDALEILEHE